MNVARRTAVAIVVALAALVVMAALAQGAGTNPKTLRVSIKPNGKELSADSEYPSVSANGKFISFESGGKFVKGDSGFDFDIFVRNRTSGKIDRVSVKSNGKEAASGDSEQSSISADGRYVAFGSDASLVNSDSNGVNDIYVHDRKTGKTVRASVRSDGVQLTTESLDPSISADGRWVAWDSEGSFASADTNGASDVYVRDLKKDKTLLVSRENGGSPVPMDLGVSSSPSVSGDGRFIAFQSDDQSMTAETDLPSFPPVLRDTDIFVRDMKKGKTVRASLQANGTEPDNGQQFNTAPSISADGKKVAFIADPSGKFVAADTNPYDDVYVKSLGSGAITLASVRSDGTLADNSSGIATRPVLSGDGRYVAFESFATLDANDTDGVRDVYVHDVKSGKTTLASVKSNGDQVDTYDHQEPAISADGKWVGFSSFGAFTGNDAGTDFDTYLRGPLH